MVHQLRFHHRATRRHAFSLIDLLMTMTVLAIVTAIAIPALKDNHRLRIRGASAIIASDIEFAQSNSIAFPNDPVMIVFDPGTASYHLALASDPDTPLNRPDTGEPYVVALGSGRARVAESVTFTLAGVTDNRIAFSPHGGMESFTSTPRISLSHPNYNDARLRLTIDPMTGTITERWLYHTSGQLDSSDPMTTGEPIAPKVPLGSQ